MPSANIDPAEPIEHVPKGVAQSLGRAISILGHPTVLVPASIVLALRGRVSAGQAIAMFVVVTASIVFIGAYLVHGVRAGRLSHIDVSKREERGGFYRVSMISLAVATVVLYLTHASPSAVRGTGIVLALIVVSSVVNRWIKASLHTAFAIVAAGVVGVGTRSLVLLVCFSLAAFAVGWSRLALRRHTPTEVCVGAALGLLAALASFFANG